MCYQTVTFHFTKSKTTTSGATFSWLLCKHLNLSSSSAVYFVSYHMMKFLIVYYTDVNFCVEFPARTSIIHYLLSSRFEAIFFQYSFEIVTLFTDKSRTINYFTAKRRRFTRK